jgi:hypothetical protein
MTAKSQIASGMNPTRKWAIDQFCRMVLAALGEHDAADPGSSLAARGRGPMRSMVEGA